MRTSLAFLLACAVVAGAALHPAVAARDPTAATKADQEEPSPSVPSFPSWSFPCIPGLPRLPWLPPCNNASHGSWPVPHRPLPVPTPPAPQPAECGTPLAAMMPCGDYLTNTSVTAPPAACCDGLKAVVKDAPVCMCHVVNRDFSKLLPAPMLRLRMMMLPRVCGANMPFGTLRQCISKCQQRRLLFCIYYFCIYCPVIFEETNNNLL